MIRCDCKYCVQSVERRAGLLRRRNPRYKKDSPVRKRKLAQVINAYKERSSIHYAADTAKVDYRTARRWLRAEGLLDEEQVAPMSRADVATRKQIAIKVYKQTGNLSLAAEKSLATRETVKKWVDTEGVAPPVDDRKERAIAHYLKTRQISLTQKEVGASHGTVRRWLEEAGILEPLKRKSKVVTGRKELKQLGQSSLSFYGVPVPLLTPPKNASMTQVVRQLRGKKFIFREIAPLLGMSEGVLSKRVRQKKYTPEMRVVLYSLNKKFDIHPFFAVRDKLRETYTITQLVNMICDVFECNKVSAKAWFRTHKSIRPPINIMHAIFKLAKGDDYKTHQGRIDYRSNHEELERLEQIIDIRDLYEKGWTISSIVRHLKLPYSYIASITQDLKRGARSLAVKSEIKELRERLSLTQTALAQATGIHQPLISRVERGESMPSVQSRLLRYLRSKL